MPTATGLSTHSAENQPLPKGRLAWPWRNQTTQLHGTMLVFQAGNPLGIVLELPPPTDLQNTIGLWVPFFRRRPSPSTQSGEKWRVAGGADGKDRSAMSWVPLAVEKKRRGCTQRERKHHPPSKTMKSKHHPAVQELPILKAIRASPAPPLGHLDPFFRSPPSKETRWRRPVRMNPRGFV